MIFKHEFCWSNIANITLVYHKGRRTTEIFLYMKLMKKQYYLTQNVADLCLQLVTSRFLSISTNVTRKKSQSLRKTVTFFRVFAVSEGRNRKKRNFTSKRYHFTSSCKKSCNKYSNKYHLQRTFQMLERNLIQFQDMGWKNIHCNVII